MGRRERKEREEEEDGEKRLKDESRVVRAELQKQNGGVELGGEAG